MPASYDTPPSRGDLARIALDTLTAQETYFATPQHSPDKPGALRTARHHESRLRKAAAAALSAETQRTLPAFRDGPATQPAAGVVTVAELGMLRDLVVAAGRQADSEQERDRLRRLYRQLTIRPADPVPTPAK